MLKKTVLCLLVFVCFFISPVSAWEESFEGHANDISVSDLTLNGGIIASWDHGSAYTVAGKSINQSITIPRVYDGYFAYTVYPRNTMSYATTHFFLELVNADGSVYCSGSFLDRYDNIYATKHRIEFIQSGSVITAYRDGNVIPFTTLNNPGSANAASIRLRITTDADTTGAGASIDDISSTPTIVSCDSSVTLTDNYQYYRVGWPVTVASYWFTRLYGPSGALISQVNVTDLTEKSIARSSLTDGQGTYTIRLYQHDNLTSNNYYYSSRAFNYGSATTNYDGTVELDDTEYLPGDIINIWTHLDTYSAGYRVNTRISTSSGFKDLGYSITNEDQHGSITIPDDAKQSGNVFMYIIDPYGEVAGYATYNIFLTKGGPQIAFDKNTYDRSDTAIITYKNAPTGSEIDVNFKSGASVIDQITYDATGGNGYISVNLSEYTAADNLFVELEDYNNVIRASDSANIITGYYLLKGRVYDSITGAALSGADVTLAGNTSTTDSQGNYELTVLAGRNDFTVFKEGYLQLQGSVSVYDLITDHNFFITPITTIDGVGIYGTVSSYRTDAVLSGASVVITNNDNGASYSTITDSRGYYEINHADLAGNCTVRISKANYDTATQDLLLDAMTYVNFRLNAVAGYEEIDLSGSTGGSGEVLTAEEQEYREKYGEMGEHPFDFNSDGSVSGDEWRYAVERLVVLIGCLVFMGFMAIVGRGGRR